MSLSTGPVWVLLFCLVVTNPSAAYRPMTEQGCPTPPTGLWGIELYEPPSNPTVLVYGYLLLTSSFKNTYSGMAVVFPVDGSWSLRMNLVGMFEMDSCFLYGVLVSHELGVIDNFRWNYDGSTMDGIFVASVGGESVYDDYAKHSLIFLDSTNATTLDEALSSFLDIDSEP